MKNVQNGDVVTVIYYKLHSMRNCTFLVGRADSVTLRKEGVYKSGEKTCMIDGTRWKHKDILNTTHKEGNLYDHYMVVVENPDLVDGVLEEVKDLIQGSKDKLKGVLKDVVTSLGLNTSWDIKDKRLED